jgi:septal ring factor EnvC (AmiA/AmiB activator)
MSLEIKLALVAGVVVLAAIAGWYVQGLRAEVDALSEALTRSQAVMEQMETNLARMEEAGRVVREGQESAARTVAAMNREIRTIKENAGHEESRDLAVNAVLAEQLNRLFR